MGTNPGGYRGAEGTFFNKDEGLLREALGRVPITDTYAAIITGVRRSGKSTLCFSY